ncbi:insertion element protein [Niallia circulans]|jgi:transposase-like protein|nr:insertion element protein [Niallia circulans]
MALVNATNHVSEAANQHRGINKEQVCVLVAKDRTKATVLKVVVWACCETKVDGMIGSKLTPNNVLVTDALRAYKKYVKEKG